MRSPNCVACHSLWKDSAALLLEYNAALDALASTPRRDPAYAQQWATLANVSQRLYEAQRLEHVHQDRQHSS